jgi:hypothetical protein
VPSEFPCQFPSPLAGDAIAGHKKELSAGESGEALWAHAKLAKPVYLIQGHLSRRDLHQLVAHF